MNVEKTLAYLWENKTHIAVTVMAIVAGVGYVSGHMDATRAGVLAAPFLAACGIGSGLLHAQS